MTAAIQSVTGTVEFVWDDGDQLLVNIDPEIVGAPHTFEIGGELRCRVAGELVEGRRVEVDFVAVEHEVVDPDSGPSESHRTEIRDVRPAPG
ncbi:hypothetical protein LCGC14_1886540 [marine sediment metagenome]|uniref:DUF5666 domain-containing protein n=1 Tax=marine sediment metagenome TaxID=412755 RepID=A0A0F9G0T3_9ZZZZ